MFNGYFASPGTSLPVAATRSVFRGSRYLKLRLVHLPKFIPVQILHPKDTSLDVLQALMTLYRLILCS